MRVHSALSPTLVRKTILSVFPSVPANSPTTMKYLFFSLQSQRHPKSPLMCGFYISFLLPFLCPGGSMYSVYSILSLHLVEFGSWGTFLNWGLLFSCAVKITLDSFHN